MPQPKRRKPKYKPNTEQLLEFDLWVDWDIWATDLEFEPTPGRSTFDRPNPTYNMGFSLRQLKSIQHAFYKAKDTDYSNKSKYPNFRSYWFTQTTHRYSAETILYQQQLHGDQHKQMMREPEHLRQLFLSRIKTGQGENDCWIWQGQVFNRKYPIFKEAMYSEFETNHTRVWVQQFTWGPWAETHRVQMPPFCERLCVNPRHMPRWPEQVPYDAEPWEDVR